jgi:hypothetical protein
MLFRRRMDAAGQEALGRAAEEGGESQGTVRESIRGKFGAWGTLRRLELGATTLMSAFHPKLPLDERLLSTRCRHQALEDERRN